MKGRGLKFVTLVLGIMTVSALLISGVTPVSAEDKADAQEIVDKAKVTFESFMRNKDYTWLQENVKNAKGILIYP
jgi:hypothetical protein